MSLYALLHYNEVFSGAAALSPSLWTSPDTVKDMIASALVRPGSILYMDYGSKELGNRREMYEAFGKATELLFDKGIYLTSRIVPGGEHCESSWERQIPFFMNTLMYDL